MCQKLYKVCSFVAPTTTVLQSKDELALGEVAKLWVGSLFSVTEERSPGRAAASMLGGRPPKSKKNQGCFDRHLTTTQSANQLAMTSIDFNSALVLPGGMDTHITEPDIHGRGTGLSACAGYSSSRGPASGTKDA